MDRHQPTDLTPARLSCLLRSSTNRDILGISSLATVDGITAEVHATRRGDLYDVVYDLTDGLRHLEVVHTDVPATHVHSSARLAAVIDALAHAPTVHAATTYAAA